MQILKRLSIGISIILLICSCAVTSAESTSTQTIKAVPLNNVPNHY